MGRTTGLEPEKCVNRIPSGNGFESDEHLYFGANDGARTRDN